MVQCDVTTDGELERAAAEALEELGRIDFVVANAGFGVAGWFHRRDLDDYRRQLETNVFGVLRTAWACREALESSRGCFAIMGSVMSFVSLPGTSPYAMSKHAVRALADVEAIVGNSSALGIDRLVWSGLVGRPGDAARALDRLAPGVRGLVLCGLFASLMSSVDSIFNSISTLWSVDIYKRRLRPGATDVQVVAMGRRAILATLTVIAAVLPMLFVSGLTLVPSAFV